MKAHSLMFYKLSLKITHNIKSERTDFCERTPGRDSAAMEKNEFTNFKVVLLRLTFEVLTSTQAV